MSKARRMRRANQIDFQSHITTLANLCGDFYDFLASVPQPTDEEVRTRFTTDNNKWIKYCQTHELMNMKGLFVTNVRESWTRHTVGQ